MSAPAQQPGPGASAPALVWRVQGTLASPAAGAALARVLSDLSGARITAVHSANALLHWRHLLAGEEVDLVLEEAPFIDYRVQRQNFNAVARAREDARYAIIVAPGTLVSALPDLRTRRLAVAAPPALAALRIHELFPDPVLAPVLVELPAGADPVPWIFSGKVDAAMIPLQQADAAQGTRIVLLSDALPGAGVAVSPRLAAAVRLALIRALVSLHHSESGRAALAGLGETAFDLATDETYDGAARLLRGTWPYLRSAIAPDPRR